MNNRITRYLEANNRKLLIPFFTAGYPSLTATYEYIMAAESAGADFIEIGLPFSDPLADGPEIQFASKSALDKKLTLSQVFNLVEKVRKKSEIPLLFMGYYNPFIALGEKSFMSKSQKAGVDGLIIPDLPVDESKTIRKIADLYNISMIYLVAPTTTDERIKIINNQTSGFVYAVTVTGVTGTGKKFDSSTDKYLSGLKKKLSHKFVAGFGVSTPADAKRLSKYSDGVVIGSKLIKIIRDAKTSKASVIEIENFLKKIRKNL